MTIDKNKIRLCSVLTETHKYRKPMAPLNLYFQLKKNIFEVCLYKLIQFAIA